MRVLVTLDELQPMSNREWKNHEGVCKWVAEQLISGVCDKKMMTTYKSIPNADRLCALAFSQK
jgi:hypothetical protein